MERVNALSSSLHGWGRIMYALGIDLGSTTIKYALLSDAGETPFEQLRPPSERRARNADFRAPPDDCSPP